MEKRVAVTIWRLATNVEYRSIGHLFGISRASICCIVQEECKERNYSSPYAQIHQMA